MADADAEDSRLDHRMSDAEALMWHVEEDPLLSSNIGTVLVCDRPVDHVALRRRMAAAVAAVPRLRERVVPGPLNLAAPQWQVDRELDLDHHLRRVALASPATPEQLWDLCARLMQDPLDRTRPLWQFWVIDGLDGGRGAVLVKLHHSVADGEGALRLAERYLVASEDAPEPPEVDLDEVLASAAEAERNGSGHRGRGAGGNGPPDGLDALGSVLGDALRRPLDGVRRLAAEVMMTAADPARAPEVGGQVVDTVRMLADQLSPGDRDGGSPLWRNRSRRRVLLPFSLPLDDVLGTARRLGGTLNEVFVSAAVEAAVRYHDDRDVPLQTLHATFALSVRGNGAADVPGNAFTLAKARVPARFAEPADRFDQVAQVLRAVRDEITGTGNPIDGLAGVANLLPTPWLTQVARAQTRHVDFATSNLRHAPFPVYLGGAKVLANHPIGPLAGTAWNCTVVSYDGSLDVGLHVDPAAVDRPDELRDHLVESFADLAAAPRTDVERLTTP